jgi:mono/diheme cytochrome c family protein
MLKYVIVTLIALTFLTLVFAGFRGAISREPPILIFDDMVDQPKYKNQGESAFFPDSREMRLPPAGTMAWGRKVDAPDRSLLVDDLANYELKVMPAKLDYALMQKGQKLFTTYCQVCHGGFGTGNGITTQYGQAPPANYHTERLVEATDGYLYRVITEGKGLMGPYGPSIKPEDRWAIVAYVRALQRAGMGRIQDVPENLQEELKKE